MLPETLICLLSALLALSQSTQQLALESLTPLSTTGSSSSNFGIPSSESLTISVALCSDSSVATPPKFTITNDTSGSNSWEIRLNKGFGSWKGRAAQGGTLRVENAGNTQFEIGVSCNNH